MILSYQFWCLSLSGESEVKDRIVGISENIMSDAKLGIWPGWNKLVDHFLDFSLFPQFLKQDNRADKFDLVGCKGRVLFSVIAFDFSMEVFDSIFSGFLAIKLSFIKVQFKAEVSFSDFADWVLGLLTHFGDLFLFQFLQELILVSGVTLFLCHFLFWFGLSSWRFCLSFLHFLAISFDLCFHVF